MPAQGRGANLAPRAPLKNPLPPNPGPKAKAPARPEAHAPMANLPAYKAPAKPSGAFSPKLQNTFGALGKRGVGAPSKLAKDQSQGASTGHSLFSLHTLEDVLRTTHDATYGRQAKTGEKASPVKPPGAAVAGTIPSGKLAEGLGTAVKNVPNSAVNTIAGAIPALYGTAKAGVEAAKGNPKELEEIGKGIGHVLAHPWSSFQENPVGTGLMFVAPESAVGRGAGAVMRSGALGAKAEKLASMDRAPLYVYGRSTGASTDQLGAGLHDVSIPRTYSPDVIRKGGQASVEQFKKKVLRHNPNIATHEQANRLLYGGGALGQYAFRGRLQGSLKPGLVDMQAATGEMMRRLYSNTSNKLLRDIKPKHGAEAVPLAVEGIIRRPETAVADLQKEHARLVSSAQGLTGREAKLNRNNQVQIEKLLTDRKFLANPQPAFDAATHYAAHMRPLEERLVHLGHLEPDQLHARNVPFALAHMKDVTFNETPGNHPMVASVSSGKRAVGAAQKALERAKGAGDKGAIMEAKARLLDARGAHANLHDQLRHLKASGAIKASGEMWPRLEQKGAPLAHHVIEAEMKKQLGDRNVGFLTHKAEQSYGRSLQSFAGKRPGTEVRRRTGVSFGNGTYDRSYEALKLQGYTNANALAGHENFDTMLNRFGIGRFHDDQTAKAALDNFRHTPEGKELETSLGKMTVQRIGPERVISRGNVDTSLLGPAVADFNVAVHKGIDEVADNPKYTLLPEAVAKRLVQHEKLNNPGGLKRALQWYTGKFRSAKLYTSPRWMFGNPQEEAIRLAFSGINPFALLGRGQAHHLGKDVIGKFEGMAGDPSLTDAQRYVAKAHVAAYAAGGHYGSMAVNDVHRELASPKSVEFAKSLGTAFDESTPVSKMLKGWQSYKHAIGNAMSRMEQNAKAAHMGRVALDEQKKFSAGWWRLITRQDRAVRDYAQGKLSPNEAVKLGNDIMEAAGNWTHLTPMVREGVQTVTPFGLWWLNSMKFIFRTLPRDHPFKTAALAAMEAGVGTEGILEKQKSYLAGGVDVTLPYVGKITLTPGYYSPAAIAIEPGKTAAGNIGPQFMGPLMSSQGISQLTGEGMKTPEGKPLDWPHAMAQAGKEVVEGPLPFAPQVQSVTREGGAPVPGVWNPFTAKPGTQRGLGKTLVKTVSPFRYNYAEPVKGGRKERERPARPERKRPERKERERKR